ncbi:unnamed protein product [Symbiodinium sp. CCMP2592]|nr:unnamed protein product [Symbiodinium sp. CCMP2592]
MFSCTTLDMAGVVVPFGAEWKYPSLSSLGSRWNVCIARVMYCHEFYKGYIHTMWDIRGKWPKDIKDGRGRSLSPARDKKGPADNDYGPEGPPNPLTNPKFFCRMVTEGWDAIVAAVVLVFGLAAGHGPDVYHCVAISCSAGCHRSLSAAMVIAFVFNMGLWSPSMQKEYDEVVEVIKELTKIAEIKISEQCRYMGLQIPSAPPSGASPSQQWLPRDPPGPPPGGPPPASPDGPPPASSSSSASSAVQGAKRFLAENMYELHGLLTEMKVDPSAWTVARLLNCFFCVLTIIACWSSLLSSTKMMASLAAERSDMAREFVMHAESQWEANGGYIEGAFDNPSAAVMWHCKSRFNRISGHLVMSKAPGGRLGLRLRIPAAALAGAAGSCHHDDLGFDLVFDKDGLRQILRGWIVSFAAMPRKRLRGPETAAKASPTASPSPEEPKAAAAIPTASPSSASEPKAAAAANPSSSSSPSEPKAAAAANPSSSSSPSEPKAAAAAKPSPKTGGGTARDPLSNTSRKRDRPATSWGSSSSQAGSCTSSEAGSCFPRGIQHLTFKPPPPAPVPSSSSSGDVFAEWTSRFQALLSLKTRVCWMLDSDGYATARRHGGDPHSIQQCVGDPVRPKTPGEARDAIQVLDYRITQLRQWETLYSLHNPELAMYAQYVQHNTSVAWFRS